MVCAVWRREPTLLLMSIEDRLGALLSRLGRPVAALQRVVLVFDGRRFPIAKPTFVIGRHTACDLQIKDGRVSRRHAMVVTNHRGCFIKDLGGHAGVLYGMQIDNKRIEDGDVFDLAGYQLAFAFDND